MKTKIKTSCHSISAVACSGAFLAGAILLVASGAKAQNLYATYNNKIYEFTPSGSQ